MIIFKKLGILGQLGNQLFQIAATLAHAKRMDTHAKFPPWKYKHHFEVPIEDDLVMDGEYAAYNRQHIEYTQSRFHYEPIPANKNILLLGFFQSEKFFADQKDYVLQHFTPTSEFFATVRKAGSQWWQLQNLTAVHVRRGDYLKRPEINNVLPVDYYDRGMETIEAKYGPSNFVFFSDDIAWCRETFGEKYYYSEGNSEIVDLYLMALCRHHIIANSSFSWWGTYLKQLFFFIGEGFSYTSSTIAPATWFGPEAAKKSDTKDLYCPDWIKI